MWLYQNLYESIKNEPFKIPEDDGNDLTHTFFNPDREGWLLKLGECWQPDGCSLGRVCSAPGTGLNRGCDAHRLPAPGSVEHGHAEG